ncbi:MAG: helix-turn-helix transcriptional regulator [Fusobacterium gastrosuis]|uniref:helix-turn-helix domain-containing protein n=1 Tax=Fusobacterium TaxID=848 RepID=UPI0025C05DBF|nr:helix-turn-helix transcriptional regulator [Fusobacterium sp.]MCI7224320.1 helix-turn-helix domain-containing protein [Fusobacterium sp.]MDY5794708.1 helix-turn-helix transcriptional regulator [Fusobacterium gastrosuis]
MLNIKSKINESIKNEYKRYLGIFLKELRTSRGFSLRELGKRTNLNFPYLSHIEAHKEEKTGLPSPDTFNKLFSIYSLSKEEKKQFIEIYLNIIMPEIFTKNLTDEKIESIVDILDS